MQKPRIQDVCRVDYKKDVRDLLLDILEWFEASPHLTARHQTQLQRYGLLQETLGRVELSIKSCRLAKLDSLSSMVDCRASIEFASGRVSLLSIIVTEAAYKGQILSVTSLKNADSVLAEISESKEEDIQDRNLDLLEELQCGLQRRQLMVGFRPGLEENALRFLQTEEIPLIHYRNGWSKVELSSGGWGIASYGVEVGDLVYTVVVGQTQNNTAICCSLILRENSEGIFSVVSLALDHLGFESTNRQRPSQALVAPMPPRANKGDRQRNLRLAMDPGVAFRMTSPTGVKTLGYGWRTTHKMAW
ncbi:hypothetical protein F5Y05DRAFT_402919 [Hypoxylon sp. FL0543]|nr:hypothetical protein F5Y05DRAFT_402919 [Hypoxylon sp. FL0543]